MLLVKSSWLSNIRTTSPKRFADVPSTSLRVVVSHLIADIPERLERANKLCEDNASEPGDAYNAWSRNAEIEILG